MSNEIDESRRRILLEGVARGDSDRVIAVAAGVAKLTVERYRRSLPQEPAEYPTADQAAQIIIAAANEINVPLGWLVDRWASGDANGSIPRVRTYAALALRRLFPNCPPVAIGRMVGARKPDNYLGTVTAYSRKGLLKWFDPAALDRVVAALERAPVETESEGLGSPVEENPRPHGESLQYGLDTSSTTGTVDASSQGEVADAANVAIPEGNPESAPRFLPIPSEPTPRWNDKVSRTASTGKRALYDMLADAVRNTPGSRG